MPKYKVPFSLVCKAVVKASSKVKATSKVESRGKGFDTKEVKFINIYYGVKKLKSK